jgi:SAM-dependent methyltransferase
MTDSTPARDRFFELLTAAIHDGTMSKLTLGKYRGDDATLHNLFVRPIALKAGPHLSFVWRHATRDLTQNLPPAEALEKLHGLVGQTFLDAHLFTAEQTAQLQCEPQGRDRLALHAASGTASATAAASHDRAKQYLIPADRPWLRDLGVTNPHAQPRAEIAHKFRQIQKFAELVRHLLTEAGIEGQPEKPLRIVDMGCGKGYLTFSVAELLGDRAEVVGIELRPGLVEECNALAKKHGLAGLRFEAGSIADTPQEALDVLIALHACDTATDDALASGHRAGARLLLVAPCCQKELRPQLQPSEVLAPALRHGIWQERHAEFATDALRALLLEWAGYRTKVFEFISQEHTAKNLMIAAVRSGPQCSDDSEEARRVRELARFYGIRSQRLAAQLGFDLRATA